MDIRQYVVALSTVQRPSASMETLKLAFKVATLTSDPGLERSCGAAPSLTVCACVVLQMYEKDDSGEVTDDDLASILEIMLGVENLEVALLFLSLDEPDAETITYGKTQPASRLCVLWPSPAGTNSSLFFQNHSHCRRTATVHRAAPWLRPGSPLLQEPSQEFLLPPTAERRQRQQQRGLSSDETAAAPPASVSPSGAASPSAAAAVEQLRRRSAAIKRTTGVSSPARLFFFMTDFLFLKDS